MRSAYDTSDPAEWKAPPARPDAATLREQVTDSMTYWLRCLHEPEEARECFVCLHGDDMVAAVLSVLAENGLVEREARDGE